MVLDQSGRLGDCCWAGFWFGSGSDRQMGNRIGRMAMGRARLEWECKDPGYHSWEVREGLLVRQARKGCTLTSIGLVQNLPIACASAFWLELTWTRYWIARSTCFSARYHLQRAKVEEHQARASYVLFVWNKDVWKSTPVNSPTQ